MTLIDYLLLWCALAVLVSLLWAAACGPADYDEDYWPTDEGIGR